MQLTEQSYFSTQVARELMSASQVKRFLECEALALAEIRGDFRREESTALLVGGYVDAFFSRTLADYVAAHPQIYTNKGTLRSDFAQAEDIIAMIQGDPLLMHMISGETQKIVTGEIAGVPFRGKLDSLLSAEQCHEIAALYPEMAEDLMMADGCIVDLKIMRDMEPVWVKGAGRVSFVSGWRYDIQLAIYQELIGGKLPCYLVVATKEKVPDKALIRIPQYMMDAALDAVRELIPRFHELKHGLDDVKRCGKCEWCKRSKLIGGAVDADELEGGGL